MKAKNKIIAVLMMLAVALAFTACDNSQSEPTETVTIHLDNVDDPSSRTIRPDAVPSPDSFNVTLQLMTKESGAWAPVSGKTYTGTGNEGATSVTITDVAIGTYKVTVDGILGGAVCMTGSTEETDSGLLSVTPKGSNKVSITLEVVYEGTTKGTLETTFDFTPSVGSSRIKSLLDNGGFNIVLVKDSDQSVLGKQTVTDLANTVVTVSMKLDPTPGTAVHFEIWDNSSTEISECKLVSPYIGGTVIWISPNTTSRPMDGEEGVTVTPDMVSYGRNLKSVTWSYNAKDSTQCVDINFKHIMEGLVEEVMVYYRQKGSSDEWQTKSAVAEKGGAVPTSGTVTIGPLTPDVEYEIATQVFQKSGMASTMKTWTFDDPIKTKVKVTGIKISGIPDSIVQGGDAFTPTVTITPSEASIKTYTWTIGNSEMLTLEENTFTPVKAGVTTITVTTDDLDGTTTAGSGEGSGESVELLSDTATIRVALPAPQNVQAVAADSRITVTWDSVPNASQYDIYRNDLGDSNPIATGVTGTSWDDTNNLLASKTYTYQVVAKNPDLNDRASGLTVDSAKGETAKGVEIADTIITFTIASLEDGFDIHFTNDTLPVITSGGKLAYEVYLAGSTEEKLKYTWKVNGTEVGSGTFTEDKAAIVLNESTEGLKLETASGYQELLLVITDANGKEYSNQTSFYAFVDDTNSTVTITLAEGTSPYRVSSMQSADEPTQLKLTASVTSDDLDQSTVAQRVKWESLSPEVVTVDIDGNVTFVKNAYTKESQYATIQATSIYGDSATFNFDVYDGLFGSEKEFLNTINSALSQVLSYCGDQISDDWRAGSGGWTGGRSFVSEDKTVEVQGLSSTGSNGEFMLKKYAREIAFSGGTVTVTFATNYIESNDDCYDLYIKAEGSAGEYWGTQALTVFGSEDNDYIDIMIPSNNGTIRVYYDNVTVDNSAISGTYRIDTFGKTYGYDGNFAPTTSESAIYSISAAELNSLSAKIDGASL